ncbi:hypothetical protein K435DRAFT_860523 [Dendrothele bispora CBS 962.96]|uniref:Uncharacterized protein n=1 Tax=Dendrothele bispora (strain CBS 962.96) TaxID=1314807 RepID=A0A4V4HFD0_DENBC|nr:hypothetical protein K435DRAFT_860523 [Dendrothele bispora CBS 962.96]
MLAHSPFRPLDPEYFDDAVLRIVNDDGSFLVLVPRPRHLPVERVELSPIEAPEVHSYPSPFDPSSCTTCSNHTYIPCPLLASTRSSESDSDTDSFSSLPALVTPDPSSPSDSPRMNPADRPDTPLPQYVLPPSYSNARPVSPPLVQLPPLTYDLTDAEVSLLEAYEHETELQDWYLKALEHSIWTPHTPHHTPYPRIRLSYVRHSTNRFGFHSNRDLFFFRISMGRTRFDTLLAPLRDEVRLWIDPLPMIDHTRFQFCMQYVFEEVVTCVFGDEEYTFPCTIYVYVRDWNLTWSEVANHCLFGTIPNRYGEEGMGPFGVERFRLWTSQFIVEELGDDHFRVLHKQGIKKRGRGIPVLENRGRLEDDMIDYWWRNRHIWKFSREAFGCLAMELIPCMSRYWILDVERRLDWLYAKCFPFWSHKPMRAPPHHVFKYNLFSPTSVSFTPVYTAPPLLIPDVEYDYSSVNNPFGTSLFQSV